MPALKVLIVEDSPCQAEYLSTLCRSVGVSELATAENGLVALELIDKTPSSFDILICDLEMPDLDGIELIHLLAHRHSCSALIIVSSREQSLISAVELMAVTEGIDVLGSIRKPVSADALEALIKNFRGQAVLKTKGSAGESLVLTTQELKQGLEQHQFVLHYQPKLVMDNGMLHGLEALVRFRHPERGLLYPGDFIELCEQNGLIDQLSFEVISMALQQLAAWNQQGFTPKVSVNLSGRSFSNSAFTHDVIKLLSQAAIAPADLIFEVTETVVIDNIGGALAFLSRLRLHGFGLSIDDYGTGYSSVKQLSQIPFTELKMDRSLIDGIASKSHLQVIFESTLSMCNKLGIALVAEGIEKAKDWDYLRLAGCHVAQGYYISPAMPSHEIVNWVRAGMPALHNKMA
jgi:EAL domain-containing protein (putative c-di-GMP-specific phosphodiesterase class I)/FixJ family two-component response regulator